MLMLTKLRLAAGLSQSALARVAGLNNSTVNAAERRRLRLYDGQLAKLARALGYTGDPADLLQEVGGDASDQGR